MKRGGTLQKLCWGGGASSKNAQPRKSTQCLLKGTKETSNNLEEGQTCDHMGVSVRDRSERLDQLEGNGSNRAGVEMGDWGRSRGPGKAQGGRLITKRHFAKERQPRR